MGTFFASRIQTARVEHKCRCCGGTIPAGTRYLRHAAGLKNRYPICLDDAVKHSRYDCQAVRDYTQELPNG